MGNTAIRAANFTNSIGINTHLSYTDGAYANVSNVESDLAYIGVKLIRDAVPNPNGGTPALNQITALEALAARGVRFDLLTYPNSITIKQTLKEIENLDKSTAGAVFAVEGANEINNNPVTYGGLTGQAAATAFQTALYSAINGTAATAGISVYDFTGGITSPILAAGTMTRNANGSYKLVNGNMGFNVALPKGVSTITLTYTGQSSGSPGSGLFGTPGQGQKTGITYGSNGTITYTYDNTSGAAQSVFVDFIDWNQTSTLTNVKVTGPGSTTNLVTFDPNLSLTGEANFFNIHPYPTNGGAIGWLIASNYKTAFGSATPGPRVITETGYTTDPNATGGVSQTVQAQQIINGLLDAYQSGVSTTYLYELLDEKSDPSNTNPEMHYGLFNNNNTPKTAAVALHDLTTILADTGSNASSFSPGTLNYTVTGANAADNSMLFEKSSGAFDIALWNDDFAGTNSYDSVKVNLGGTFATVLLDDVVTGAQTSYSNVSQITVALAGDPMIIQIEPASVNAARMSFAAAPATAQASTSASKRITAAVSATGHKPTTSTPSGFISALTSQTTHEPGLLKTVMHGFHAF